MRNFRGFLIPLNGKICQLDTSSSRDFISCELSSLKKLLCKENCEDRMRWPLTLEVVQHIQTVEPERNSLELTQFAENLNSIFADFQERITNLESSMENMHGKRKDKIHQEMVKLEDTVNFLTKRIDEAETIEWHGMFVKNPLW